MSEKQKVAEAYIRRKLAMLGDMSRLADPRSMDFIAVQVALVPAEGAMAAALTDVLTASQRQVGMALAQSAIESLILARDALSDLGVSDTRELHSAFIGRLADVFTAITGGASK